MCNPLTKKPCYPHGQQGLARVNIFYGTFQSKYVVCCFLPTYRIRTCRWLRTARS